MKRTGRQRLERHMKRKNSGKFLTVRIVTKEALKMLEKQMRDSAYLRSLISTA